MVPGIIQRIGAALAAVLLSYGAVQADSWVQEYAAFSREAREACGKDNLPECRDALLRLSGITDGRPDLLCRLASVESRLGDSAQAMIDLRVCAASGLNTSDFEPQGGFSALRAAAGFPEIEQIHERMLKPAMEYQARFSLPDADFIAEDIAFDPKDGSFLVSSVRKRGIVRVDRRGHTIELPVDLGERFGGVYALALDPKRRVLWATMTAGRESPPYSDADAGRSEVLKIDLKSSAILARVALGDGAPHAFGDMTLSDDGQLFVSDGLGGGVYVIRNTEAPTLETLVPPGALRSPQTPALLSEGRVLLVPDYSRGIAVIDLKSRALSWLKHPPELALSGIDGFYARGRVLVAIENGTIPERVLVLKLDRTARKVQSWRVAVARAPNLGDPTHGTFVGGDFYFLANSGWDRVAVNGDLKDRPNAGAPQIWRISLGGAR